jgi:polyisoprenoid-binding protein YceI
MATNTLTRIGIPTGVWRVDKARTRVGFAVKSLGFTTVRGEFREFDGALEIGDDFGDWCAYGRVKAASIDTGLRRRDEHLRSTDFLSAEQHPELVFRSKGFVPVDEHTLRIVGYLSINGVTNEVDLTAELGGTASGPDGEERIRLEVTGEVYRTAFGMTLVAALGSLGVADKVKIAIEVEAAKEE